MPAIGALVAEQGVEVAGLVEEPRRDRRAQAPATPRGRGWRPSRRRRPLRRPSASPRRAAWSRTRAAATHGRRRSGPGPASAGPAGMPARRRPAAVPRTSCGRAGRTRVAVAELDDRHLADPADARDRSADERVERRLERSSARPCPARAPTRPRRPPGRARSGGQRSRPRATPAPAQRRVVRREAPEPLDFLDVIRPSDRSARLAKIKDQAAREGREVPMQELPTVQVPPPSGLVRSSAPAEIARAQRRGEGARRSSATR